MLKSLCALRLSSRLLGIRLYVKGSSAPPTTVSSGVPEQLSAEEEEAIYQENFRRALAELKTHDYPKGTKVGRYVMGDYGLYRPRYRKFQEMYIEAAKKGIPTYLWRGKSDEIIYQIMTVLWIMTLIYCFYLFAVLYCHGDPLETFKAWRKRDQEQ